MSAPPITLDHLPSFCLIQIWWKFDIVIRKNNFACFFLRHGVILCFIVVGWWCAETATARWVEESTGDHPGRHAAVWRDAHAALHAQGSGGARSVSGQLLTTIDGLPTTLPALVSFSGFLFDQLWGFSVLYWFQFCLHGYCSTLEWQSNSKVVMVNRFLLLH